MQLIKPFKTLLLILACVFTLITSQSIAQSFQFESEILSESSISINGETNVRSVKCAYPKPFPTTILRHTSTLVDSLFQVQGDTLFLNVKALECGKRAINRDMRKTLKQSEFPFIKSWIDRIILHDDGETTAIVSVYLADVIREYDMPIQSDETEDVIRISGSQPIKLSEFDLITPSVLFGAIRVKDEFIVEFDIHLRQKIELIKKGS